MKRNTRYELQSEKVEAAERVGSLSLNDLENDESITVDELSQLKKDTPWAVDIFTSAFENY